MPKAYQQSGPYIPRKDSDFQSWVTVFARHVAECPGKYGLSDQDSQILTGLAKDFSELFYLVQSPESRTPSLIARKDAIRASAAGTFRIYAKQIHANLGVDNSDKIGLGLHIPDRTRTPIGRPDTAPLLNVLAAFSGSHVLRYADATTPNSRRKPPGAENLQLWMAIGDEPVTDPRKAELIGIHTRCPIQVRHKHADAGKAASYFARWVTRRGLLGPWSLPVWMQVAFGGGMHEGAVADGRSSSHSPETMKQAA